MCGVNWLYLLPFVPLVTRLILAVRFLPLQQDILDEAEHDRESYRNHILAFAGFSFLGVSAFSVVEASLRAGLASAIYFLLISFFSYMFALNMVSYKGRRWEDLLATALSEAGTLSLFLSLIATLVATRLSFAANIAGIATFVWGVDHTRRLSIDWRHQAKLLQSEGEI
jgi:dolichol kinase